MPSPSTMESDQVIDPAGAAAQLESLEADRAAIASRAMQPWWHDALLGLLLFGFLSTYSSHHPWGTVAALPVFRAGLFGLVVVHERITGFSTIASRQRTSPALTGAGRAAFAAHVVELRRITGG